MGTRGTVNGASTWSAAQKSARGGNSAQVHAAIELRTGVCIRQRGREASNGCQGE